MVNGEPDAAEFRGSLQRRGHLGRRDASFCVGDAAILLLKLDGRLHAYQGRCPHQGIALVEGELDGTVLTCRAHHWQFNASNGEGINPRNARLERFSTKIVAGKVLISVPDDDAGDRGSTRAPCVAS
jgi:nitrite reductase/ring-hydroxylating ferredoxin subunit